MSWPTVGRGWRRWAVCVLAAAFVAAGSAVAEAQVFTSFQSTQDIVFGIVATGQASGTVTIDPQSGGTTTTGGISFFGGTVQPARFSGRTRAANKCTVTLTFPASVPVAGAGSATLSHFTLSPASVSIIASNPTFSFQVGGRLTVPAGAPAGVYTGTLTVTAVFTDC